MIEFYFTLRVIAIFVVFAIAAFIFVAGIVGYLLDKNKKKKHR